MVIWLRLSLLILASVLAVGVSKAASNQFLTYQGILTNTNDEPYTTSQTVVFAIYSPTPSSCLLYSETHSITPDSKGRFSAQIGSGVRTDTTGIALHKIFVNAGSFSGLTCGSGGTTYTPGVTDDRSMVISVNGTAMSPAVAIKSVPFAMQAREVNGWGVDDLVKIHPTTGSPTTFTSAEMAVAKTITGLSCATNEILKWNGSAWMCAADASGGASPGDAGYGSAAKGLVAFDTNATTSGITVSSGVAKLSNTGVSAASYGSATSVPTISIDAQGRVTLASNTSIALPPSQITQASANTGDVLKWNGTAWAPSADATGGSPGDATYAAKGLVQGLSSASISGLNISAGVISVNMGTGANQIVQLDGTGKLPNVDGSALTNLSASNISAGTLPILHGGTSATSFSTGSLIVANGTGSALTSLTCSMGEILKWGGTSWDCVIGTSVVSDSTYSSKGLIQVDSSSAVSGLTLTSGVLRLATSGVDAGTYRSVTVDTFGRVTGGTNPTTASGYGLTDVFVNDGNSFAGDAIIGTNDSHPLKLETAGAARITILSNGNVGIGTTAPGKVLQVASNSTSETISILRTDNANQAAMLGFAPAGTNSTSNPLWSVGLNAGSNDFRIATWDGTTTTNRLSIANNGNVGIGTGTDTFNERLMVRSGATDSAAPMKIQHRNPAAYVAVDFVDSGDVNRGGVGFGNASAPALGGQFYLGTTEPNPVVIRTDEQERIRVLATGEVGIATLTPSAQLDVNGDLSVDSSYEGVSGNTTVTTSTYTIPNTLLNIRRITLNTTSVSVKLPVFTAPLNKVYSLTVFIKQDGTVGTRTVTFSGNTGDTIKWDGGTQPAAQVGVNKVTIYQFIKAADEPVWYGSMVWKEN